ncbi:DNA-3-methyladenine glycosylase [Thermosynechococcus sp. HY213]|uniref:DNA-3-methyladenine glycosylase n=2 Tax=Thermosynechococcus TaxID=146785 RepID=UPI00285501C9|nr:DNA-3-methyladenine glycosylase [Thermosynechococcus sp. HY213]MDR7922485.1 DNA-3-methyladenine glycosylase [Thermosynechococcus sp. HY213]
MKRVPTEQDQCLPLEWLARPAPMVAQELLGCLLVRQQANGQLYRGRIVETEAYMAGDPACHGYRRQTARNAPMFAAPGTIYVYQIYGIHHCLNIASDRPNFASAVLIRALEMLSPPLPPRSAAGPGKLCQVLGIDRQLSGLMLGKESGLWLEKPPQPLTAPVVQTTRIGISQGQEIPWRWYVQGNPAVSRYS